MKSERVLQDDALAAVRAQGIAALESVLAVVLETDGSFSVISGNEKANSLLRNVDGNG